MSENLPLGWAEENLGNLVLKLVDGSHNPPSGKSSGLKMLSARNILDGRIDATECRLLDQESFAQEDKRTQVEAGDVLLTIVGTIGRSAVVPNVFEQITLQRSVAVIKPIEVSPSFVSYQLRASRCQQYFDQAARGTAQKGVYLGALAQLPLFIPPIAEQYRIVDKIDELFSSIDEGERALERVRKLVGRYRQSVLKAAVTGELTRDWREHQAGELESGEALVVRILEARFKAMETAEIAKMTANRLLPVNDLWKKRYKEPTGVDASQHCELPSGWAWATLPMLCAEDSINGISVKGTNAPPGVAALRLDAITSNGFDYSAIRYIPISEAKAARLLVCVGDFFVSRANGSIRLVGKAVLANQPPGVVVFPDTMIRYRLLSVPDLRSWLQMVWSSRFIRSQIERFAKTTAGIHKISQGDIGQIAIPVPPLEEQEEIRSLVELRLSQADRLLQEAENSLKLAKSVRHGTLKSAFSGQLVPQDSTDEPASVLLERLAALRSATSSEMRTAKKGQGKRGVPAGLTTRGTSTRKGKA